MASLFDFLNTPKALAQFAYQQSVPANARLLAKSIVNPEPISAAQFTPQEMDLLRQTYANSVQRSSKP